MLALTEKIPFFTNYSDGLLLGKMPSGKYVIQHEKSKISNRNVFVVGGPGSFKTQSYILTNVVNNRKSSIVTTDPKGEVYELTSEIKRKQGYKVIVMNFKDLAISSCYNPLAYIRKPTDTNMIANVIVSAKNDPKKKDFWFNVQQSLLNSLIQYVYYEFEPSARTIESILDFLEAYDPRYNQEGVSELDQQFEQLPEGHPAQRSYRLGFQKAESEIRSNILISLLTTLTDYLDADVARMTSRNDFLFEELGKEKIALYVLISPLDRTWDGLVNLFFQQMFNELFRFGDLHNAKLPNPLVMLLDEFVNLGYFPTYENFLATCRGYRISVSTILQSFPQLVKLYGKETAEAIIGNHAIRICLGGVEKETARYFSELLGKTTVKIHTQGTSRNLPTASAQHRSSTRSENFNFAGRDLMTEGEIINLQNLDDGRRSIVVIQGKPFLMFKVPQFEVYGDLLSTYRVAQQDYRPIQTPGAKEYQKQLDQQYMEAREALIQHSQQIKTTTDELEKELRKEGE
ncbi:VirD4-like conjugal transfer protein, CD1115 family [Enterococcus hirae]|uniref:VirD4-like conjugal transfer protein, CD1115 family n=1 Tax=Enterococcus hirae TaxID=1354 RepID=UPI000FFC7DDC|nr:type IV secretory system conjugative DNA transfer family protein [Enterococcus hirae]RXA88188.1 conjugal transfer protein [Enterococcus hirae]